MRTWGGELEITVFSKLYEVDIQVYRYVTSIVPIHEYIHPNSNLTVGLYFLNGDYYNLLQKITLNSNTNSANLSQIIKKCIKFMHITDKRI